MFYYTLGILVVILYCVRRLPSADAKKSITVREGLQKLQFRYFIVLMPATFADWLQGPYLYKLYSLYGFKNNEIFLLYFTGFAASVTFGTCVSCLADHVGRKKMCIIFNVIYIISCLTKLSSTFEVLLIGRILGGIGTSILFSVFEAWYVYQHLEKQQFPLSCISITLSKATYYNGLLAILAGLISYVCADFLQLGPASPFVLAIPCLIASACFAMHFWEETDVSQNNHCNSLKVTKHFINTSMIMLCLIQSVFESIMYIFIVLWTPIISPAFPPLGIVFSCFMLCIMIGSTLCAWCTSQRFKAKIILIATMLLSSGALATCAVAELYFRSVKPQMCFVAFLFYEIAIGLYYPSVGFIRSCLIPENYRAGITSWLRVPMNIITCSSLIYLRSVQFGPENNYNSFDVHNDNNLGYLFGICALALFLTAGLGCKLPSQAPQLMYNIVSQY